MTEHEEQRNFVMWFRQTFDGVRIFAIPNGGARNVVTAARMKAEGVAAGVPDLYIPAWKTWIEFKKVKGGSVGPKQKEWIEYLESIGDTVIIARGAEHAKQEIESCGFS